MNKNTIGLLAIFFMAGVAVNASAITAVESFTQTDHVAQLVENPTFSQLKLFDLAQQYPDCADRLTSC